MLQGLAKLLLRSVLGLLAIAVLLAVFGFFCPTKFKVQRRCFVHAVPSRIFPHLDQLTSWPRWSVWPEQEDPDLEVFYEGPARGAGARQRWSSRSFGDGVLRLTRSEADRAVAFERECELAVLGYPLTSLAEGKIELEQQRGGTELRWTMTGDVGMDLAARYLALFADELLGSDLSAGLRRLRALVEKGEAPDESGADS
jgi:hypothetical protein